MGESPEIIKTLNDFGCAETLEAADAAQARLMSELEVEHHRVLQESLVSACRNASSDAGFPVVETRTGPAGVVRVLAHDKAGRGLVTEIKASMHEELGLETEVLGVSDGTCHEILDRFDQALRKQGVHGSAPRRESMGTVCHLAAAREFVNQQVRPSSTKAAKQKAKDALRRRKRIGQNSHVVR